MNRFFDAHQDAIKILSENSIEYGAVLHCFGGDVKLMKQYLETDSPYIRFDGERMPNTSLTLYDVAKRSAGKKDMTVNQITELTAENFNRLFQFDTKE